jgi:hypothetical protein
MKRFTTFAVGGVLALALSACAAPEDETPAPEPAPEADEELEPEPEPEPADEPEDEESASEDVEEAADVSGEEPGVVLLAEPVTWAEAGFELEVDAVRILSVEEFSDLAGEDLSDFLDDPQAQTLVGMRVTLRNTTDAPADWFVAGFDTAVVIEGQQAGIFFLADGGDTVRAGAELEINAYYESRVDVDTARAAGSFVWDAAGPVDSDTFETIADVGDLTISYSY